MCIRDSWKYEYWYCNTIKILVLELWYFVKLVLVLATFLQRVSVFVLPTLFKCIVNNPACCHYHYYYYYYYYYYCEIEIWQHVDKLSAAQTVASKGCWRWGYILLQAAGSETRVTWGDKARSNRSPIQCGAPSQYGNPRTPGILPLIVLAAIGKCGRLSQHSWRLVAHYNIVILTYLLSFQLSKCVHLGQI